MAITSVEFDSLKKIIIELQRILKDIEVAAGGDASEAKQDDIISELKLEGWTNTPDNSQEFVYYIEGEIGNPSDDINNVKYIIYKEGINTVITKTFTYDENNNVLTITAS